MRYSNNYYKNQKERFKTSLQSFLIIALICSVVALISNLEIVLTYLKTLLK